MGRGRRGKEVKIFSHQTNAFSCSSKLSVVVIPLCSLMFYVVIKKTYSTHCLHILCNE